MHIHPHGARDAKSYIGTGIHQAIIDNLSDKWQDMERKFLGNLRSEMKDHYRKTHRTSAATRTMSKRKRAGSKRYPSLITTWGDSGWWGYRIGEGFKPNHMARTVDITDLFPKVGQGAPAPYRS
jgi:hypothetical protein